MHGMSCHRCGFLPLPKRWGQLLLYVVITLSSMTLSLAIGPQHDEEILIEIPKNTFN